MSAQEALALANALAARERAIARTRSSRPAIFHRAGGMSRIGPMMSGALAEAYAASHGAPDAAPDQGGL